MRKCVTFPLKTQVAILSASEMPEYSQYFSIENTALQPKSAGTGRASPSGCCGSHLYSRTWGGCRANDSWLRISPSLDEHRGAYVQMEICVCSNTPIYGGHN